MKPYFGAMEHHVHQPHAATAGSRIVFSVNLSGITGIFRIVTDKNTGFMEKLIGALTGVAFTGET
jgi:hypothetical protein